MNQERLIATICDIPFVKKAPVVVFPPVLLCGLLLHLIRPWRIFPRRVLGHLAGWPLIGAALALGVWAERTMEAAGESPRSEFPTETLVTGGPFTFSRNPLYISMMMFYTGVSFILNTFWPLILLPMPFNIINRGIIPREERYLEDQFGEQCQEYMSRVGRWM